MIFNTILFDFDGTLVDTKNDVWQGLNYTREQFGLAPLTAKEVTQVLGPDKAEFLALVYPNSTDEEKDNFLAIFQDYYFERCLVSTQFFPGMLDVVKSLNGMKLAIASNKPRAFIEKILKGLNADHFFSYLISPEDVDYAKPHPEMVFKAMGALQATPEKTLLVGDTEKDVLAGKAAGVAVCFARYGYGSFDRLQDTKPDYVIQEPEALLNILK